MISAYMDNAQATRAYGAAFRRLARMSGFDHRTVLRAEAGSILKTWAGRVKVRTEAAVDRSSRLHAVSSLGYTGKGRVKARGDVTVNAGYRPAPFGRVWIKVREGNSRKNWLLAMGDNFTEPGNAVVGPKGVIKGRSRIVNGTFNKYRANQSGTTAKWVANVNDAVTDVQAKLPQSVEKGRRSVGLSRQAVLQIADSLGIDLLAVPGGGLNAAGWVKARAALATTGKAYRNGTSGSGGSEVKAYVDLICRLPYGVAIGMDRALVGVVAGRAKFIERSYAQGAFNTQRNILRAFPGLFRQTAFS